MAKSGGGPAVAFLLTMFVVTQQFLVEFWSAFIRTEYTDFVPQMGPHSAHRLQQLSCCGPGEEKFVRKMLSNLLRELYKTDQRYLNLEAEGRESSHARNPESICLSRDYSNSIGRTFWTGFITNRSTSWRVQRRAIESSFPLYQKWLQHLKRRKTLARP